MDRGHLFGVIMSYVLKPAEKLTGPFVHLEIQSSCLRRRYGHVHGSKGNSRFGSPLHTNYTITYPKPYYTGSRRPKCFRQVPLVKRIMETTISRCRASEKLQHLEWLLQTHAIPLVEAKPPRDHHAVNSGKGKNRLISFSAFSFFQTAIWGHLVQC